MDKLLEKIEQKVLLPAALASTFIMMCLTTLDAGGRYLLNNPINGAYEITEKYLMICTFYLGMTYAYRYGSNIRMPLVVTRLPMHIRLILNYVVQIIAISYCLFLLVGNLRSHLPHLTEKIYLVSYTLPMVPIYILMPAAIVILLLRMILDLWQIKHGKSGLFKDEESEEVSAI